LVCGWRKFQIDSPGDHLSNCTTHSGVKKTHDWADTQIPGPMPLVLDLHIAHDCFGSISDPSITGHLHYPNDVDRSLNEVVADKIRQYRADCDNCPSNTISFMAAIPSTSRSLHSEFVHLLFLQKLIGKLTAFLQLQEFSLCNLPVDSSTSAARRSPHISSLKSATFS
jgi:hypothetical protein